MLGKLYTQLFDFRYFNITKLDFLSIIISIWEIIN